MEGMRYIINMDELIDLEAGDTLIMPKDIPHAVYGEEQFKMQLVVSY